MDKIFDQSDIADQVPADVTIFAAADNFTVTTPVTVNRAAVYLSELFTPTSGGLEDFSGTLGWAIYTDNDGKPGTIVASGNDSSPEMRGTGQFVLNGNKVIEAQIDFGGNVTLPAGTYWLALHDDGWGVAGEDPRISWVLADSGLYPDAQNDANPTAPTSWDINIPGNLAFALLFNNHPVITSSAFLPTENSRVVGTVNATDADSDVLSYAISGGDDGGLFEIDSATGEIQFIAAPDFENPGDTDHDNVYEVEVTVDDGNDGTDTQLISVTVTNGNDRPVITSDGGKLRASVDVAENSTAVTKVQATDEDGSSISYAISGGDDKALFSINATTGKITFKAAPDFETPQDKDHDNAYQITIRATDSDGAIDVQYLTINVTDVDGVSITGTSAVDTVNANKTVDGQPLPTGEEDYILGLGGNDRLSSLGGDDILEGGAGRDILKGGAGHDHFVYLDVADSNSDTGIDRIKDFTQGEDIIDLSAIDADGAGGPFHFLGEIDFDGTAGALRQRTAGNDVLLEGDTDGNGVADLVILLKGSAGLVLSDADLFLGLNV